MAQGAALSAMQQAGVQQMPSSYVERSRQKLPSATAEQSSNGTAQRPQPKIAASNLQKPPSPGLAPKDRLRASPAMPAAHSSEISSSSGKQPGNLGASKAKGSSHYHREPTLERSGPELKTVGPQQDTRQSKGAALYDQSPGSRENRDLPRKRSKWGDDIIVLSDAEGETVLPSTAASPANLRPESAASPLKPASDFSASPARPGTQQAAVSQKSRQTSLKSVSSLSKPSRATEHPKATVNGTVSTAASHAQPTPHLSSPGQHAALLC